MACAKFDMRSHIISKLGIGGTQLNVGIIVSIAMGLSYLTAMLTKVFSLKYLFILTCFLLFSCFSRPLEHYIINDLKVPIANLFEMSETRR